MLAFWLCQKLQTAYMTTAKMTWAISVCRKTNVHRLNLGERERRGEREGEAKFETVIMFSVYY